MGVGIWLMRGSEWEPWWSPGKLMGVFVFLSGLIYFLIHLNAPGWLLRLVVFPMAGAYGLMYIIFTLLALLGLIKILSSL